MSVLELQTSDLGRPPQVAERKVEVRKSRNPAIPQSCAPYFDASSSSSASLTKSTACPRIAKVCFVSLAGSKLTRIGPRRQMGAGRAESVRDAPCQSFLEHRFAAAELCDHRRNLLAVVGHSAKRHINPGTNWRPNRCCQTPRDVSGRPAASLRAATASAVRRNLPADCHSGETLAVLRPAAPSLRAHPPAAGALS
jgi:hypothetical protein